MQMTILKAGGNNFFFIEGICFTNSFIISSEAWKSAITPSFKWTDRFYIFHVFSLASNWLVCQLQ